MDYVEMSYWLAFYKMESEDHGRHGSNGRTQRQGFK